MPIHQIKLMDRQEVAKDTVVFTFEKPNNFNFKPGQYGGFTLIDPLEKDAGGITRRFSLLSTPEDPYLSIVTRIQNSAFKRVLNNLPLGSKIKFAGPTGTFTLHEEMNVPAVLIAGGIGIAPFFSMIKDAAHHYRPQPIYLFYGNQQLTHAAFIEDLRALQEKNPHFKLIATMDKPDPHWLGETGFINNAMIKKYIKDIFSPIYYICGSPTMVTAMQELLVEMDINEEKISTEDFPGY